MRKTSSYKVMKKTVVGITVVGKDREGIVATFTNFAFSRGGNIEKVNQNVIKNLFGMYLEVSFSKKLDVKKFDIEIQNLAKKEKMDVNTHHETNLEKNIAVFVTKEPLCLQTFIENRKSLKGRISIIIGTEKSLESIARKAKIPFIAVEEKNQTKAEEKIIDICKKYNIDLISLARYMRILSPNFVWRYPNRIINIHPSLLPAFPGASAYAQAYERGTKIVGVTSHYVTENLDQGPIIFQDSFKVDPNDTLEKIKSKGQKLEADTLLKATKMHLENKLEVRWRKVHIKSK
ncbi:formyltetrahydrofolate deformylase [Nitrosopumilus sp.]|nr:formyltetrahydrofolate deformylase [Nitrosopumilus sp.]MDB4839940.1 formyltetrahydrofolate deformylase [Nitrosopumilus sp.]|tara:strand:+ start:602 stop:1471 length:870 start_codon:yes stop_codon:yes gene_type:complete